MCLEVWDRSANQPAGSLGDLGQSSLVLFFEAAEVTEAVECHHRLHCGLVKLLQQLRADAERLQLLHEVKPPFCGLIKGISPEIYVLCVRVKINKRSLKPFCVWKLLVQDVQEIKM